MTQNMQIPEAHWFMEALPKSSADVTETEITSNLEMQPIMSGKDRNMQNILGKGNESQKDDRFF